MKVNVAKIYKIAKVKHKYKVNQNLKIGNLFNRYRYWKVQ